MEQLLESLNEAQRDACKCINGPMLILAGAGSGKTRVLTYRIAWLLKQGVDPFNILALTFTNKAAAEMKSRIFQLVNNADARNVWMGTFHSVFAKILRIESEKIGYPHSFTIYDTDDCKRLVKQIIKDLDLNDKTYTPSFVLGRISSAKTSLVSPAEYENTPEIMDQDKSNGRPYLSKLYATYNAKLYESSAMDFDDLLFNTHKLFTKHHDTLLKYQHFFKYILVDEYQDTNHVQYIILKMLAAANENICVVGDDAQSIYAFRGANIANILNLKKDYPDIKIFKLEQNYRSTKNIIEAANSVISNNQNQFKKEIWTDNETGEQIKLFKANTDSEEGRIIADTVFEIRMNNQVPENHFAVLYRTNAQSRAIEEGLRRLNIPYRIFGGLSFYKRKEIKDILAYFRLIINNNDADAFTRTVNYPQRGIGQTTVDKLIVLANTLEKPLFEIAVNIDYYGVDINAGARNKIKDFCMMIRSFSAQLPTKSAYELAKQITIQTGLLKDLQEDHTPEGVNRIEHIEELLNAIKEFSEQELIDDEFVFTQTASENEEEKPLRLLNEFTQDISLLTDADEKDKDNIPKVSLMTIHAAKGLEFPYVFVAGLEENLFPSAQSLNTRTDLEEERRLFYVAITRAEKRLFLSYAELRFKWGNQIFCEPSRFIDEINPSFLEIHAKRTAPAPAKKTQQHMPNVSEPKINVGSVAEKIKSGQLKKIKQQPVTDTNSAAPVNIDLQPGYVVEHEKFGKGKIITIDGQDSNIKATVFFEGVGQKQLLLKFARLKVISK